MTIRPISLKISDDERQRFALLAKKANRSSHYLMREALVAFLNKEEQRISFIEEATAAWEQYENNGLHLPIEALEAWSKSKMKKLPPWQK